MPVTDDSAHYPEVGDVYRDKDWRAEGRQVRIVSISKGSDGKQYARCVNVATSRPTDIRLDRLTSYRFERVRHDHSAGRHQPDA